MSTSVDQRSKGQSNQGSNGNDKQSDFEYMQGHPAPNYGHPINSPNADPYMSSYYTPQYMFQNVSGQDAGPWSNGGDPMSLLGGYGQVNGEYMSGNGMYSGAFDYSHFNWNFPGGDFQPSAWSAQGRDDKHGYSDGYYMPQRDYANMNGDMEPREHSMRAVESSMKSMKINEKGDMHEQHHGGHHASSGGHSGGHSSGAPKKMSWATVASQPARPQPQKSKSIPRPLPPGKNVDMGHIGTWEGRSNPGNKGMGGAGRQAWGAGRGRAAPPAPYSGTPPNVAAPNPPSSSSVHKDEPSTNGNSSNVLQKLRSANAYNPKDFNLNPKGARFFIIKSYSEDDIHRSIKYSIWCSTEHGNKRLDSAYHERDGKGPVYLFFSVNGSGHFCGMAQMMSALDYHSTSSVWAQDKWKGRFDVKWIYVKDVPNSQLRHIRLENNENKPVTNSRDTQEVPPEKGKLVLKIIHHFRHNTSIFDDFSHYERRQEEETVVEKKQEDQGEERSEGRRDDRRDDHREKEERREDHRGKGGRSNQN